jgi:hypothetical protein
MQNCVQSEVKNGANSKNLCHCLIQRYLSSIFSLKTQRKKLYKLQFCLLNLGEKSGHLILWEEHRLRMLRERGAEEDGGSNRSPQIIM